MQSGKKVLLVFFALLFAAIGFIFWVGATGGGTANRPPMPSSTTTSSSEPTGSAPAASGSTHSGPAAHLRDNLAAATIDLPDDAFAALDTFSPSQPERRMA